MACEYCKMNSFGFGENFHDDMLNDAYLSVSAKGYAFNIKAQHIHDGYVWGTQHLGIHGIRFCPMCGSDLRGDDQ